MHRRVRSSQLLPSGKAPVAVSGDIFPPSQAEALPQTPHLPGGPAVVQDQAGPPALTPGMAPEGLVARVCGESMARQSLTPPKTAPQICNAHTDIQSRPHRDSSGTANPLGITRDFLWFQNKQLSLILMLIITAIGMAFLSDVLHC